MPFNPYAANPYGGYGTYNPYPTYPNTPTAQQQATPQPMSPPMRTVDLIQIKSVDDVANYPVNAGTVQLFQMTDDSAFVTKAVYADGQQNIDVYPKQPKKPAPPPFDPSVFVTREELEERLAGLSGRRRRKDETDAGQES